MREQDSTQRDQQLLNTIEEAIAHKNGNNVDPRSLEGFCAHLAGTAPQADDTFRRELLARLMREMPEKASYAPTSAIQTPDNSQPDKAREHRSPGGPGKRVRPLEALRAPFNGWGVQPRGKMASVLMGGGALLLILAVLAGMTFMLKVRKDTQASRTPTATRADSIQIVQGMMPVRTLDTAQVQSMAWSPDSRILATTYGNTVELWDGATGQFLRQVSVHGANKPAWSPDSRTLAVGANKNPDWSSDSNNITVELVDPTTVQIKQTLAADPAGLAWSPDSRMLATSFSPGPESRDGYIKLWDPSTGKELRTIKLPAESYGGIQRPVQVLKLGWSHDGHVLASMHADGDIKLWDPATGTLKLTPDVESPKGYYYEGPPRDFAWSSDGRTIAIISGRASDVLDPGGLTRRVVTGRAVELWDATTGKLLRTLPENLPPLARMPTEPPPPPGPAPSGVPRQQLTPWPTLTPEPPTPTLPPEIAAHEWGQIKLMAWSPGGRALATADDTTIKLWDPATGQHKLTITQRGVFKLEWSPDGQVLTSLSAGENRRTSPEPRDERVALLLGTLKLWDPTAGKELRMVMKDSASDFAWSPDGQTLAITSGSSATLWGIGSEATPTNIHTRDAAGTTTPAPDFSPEASTVCGSWSIVSIPKVGAGREELQSVSAASSRDVWAVGYYSNRPVTESSNEIRDARTLTMHWDGLAWNHTPSPNVGNGNNFLLGVEALAASDAWAVGYYTETNGLQQAMILHWNGKAWGQVPAPKTTGNSRLRAVSAVAPDDIWAVGSIDDAFTLILHWNGKTWTQVPSPSPGIDFNGLFAVSALSKDDVWAAGQYVTRYQQMGAPQGKALLLHWDGARWKVVPASFKGTYTRGVVAVSKGAGWVVGGYAGEGGGGHAISRWDGSHWSPKAVPELGEVDGYGDNNVRNSDLSGITAISKDDVWAVGSYSTQSTEAFHWKAHTLVEHWDGTAWSVAPSPNVGEEGSALTAVDAVSRGEIWAVGRHGPYNAPKALILRYDGSGCPTPTTQAQQQTALPAVTTLPNTAISGTVAPAQRPDALGNCGPSWSVVPSRSEGTLNSVAAISRSDVWTVGYTAGSPSRTLIQHWNGKDWSTIPSPNVGTEDNRLNGVAALSANDVWAVGYYGDGPSSKTLTLHWDGKEWKVVSNPDVGTRGNALQAVTAISSNDVWAVGRSGLCSAENSPCVTKTLTLHWNGTRWSHVQSPNIGTSSNSLSSIAATSKNDVWAVGSYVKEAGAEWRTMRALFLHWDGKTWSQAPGSDIEGHGISLTAITAISPNDAWAVGTYWSGDPEVANLLLHWDGKAWTEDPSSRKIMGTTVGLYGIAALSADDVWAVGWMPRFQYWNGKQWSTVTDAYHEWPEGILRGVAALAPDELWAVGGWGHAMEDSRKDALIMRYGKGPCITRTSTPTRTPTPKNTYTPTNSPTYTLTATPTPLRPATFSAAPAITTACGVWTPFSSSQFHTQGNYIADVEVVAANDVWAVGHYMAGNETLPLILHWDGSSWTHLLAPRPMIGRAPDSLTRPSPDVSLFAVDATSKDDVWAVGIYEGYWENETKLALSMHWDGRQWSIIPVPRVGPQILSTLNDMAAISKDDVWAVGLTRRNEVGRGQEPGMLIMHWDGRQWSQVATPEIGTPISWLHGISAAAHNDIWAVGLYDETPVQPVPQPVTTVSSPKGNTSATPFVPLPWKSLLLHWDGKTWSQVIVPGVDAADISLSSVNALSRDNVWLAGSTGSASSQAAKRSLTLRWDGRAWAQVPTPSHGKLYSSIGKIEALSRDDMWAIEVYSDQRGEVGKRTLLHWDGKQWGSAATSDFNLEQATLAVSSSNVWLAGTSGQKVLMARYTGSPCPGP